MEQKNEDLGRQLNEARDALKRAQEELGQATTRAGTMEQKNVEVERQLNEERDARKSAQEELRLATARARTVEKKNEELERQLNEALRAQNFNDDRLTQLNTATGKRKADDSRASGGAAHVPLQEALQLLVPHIGYLARDVLSGTQGSDEAASQHTCDTGGQSKVGRAQGFSSLPEESQAM